MSKLLKSFRFQKSLDMLITKEQENNLEKKNIQSREEKLRGEKEKWHIKYNVEKFTGDFRKCINT